MVNIVSFSLANWSHSGKFLFPRRNISKKMDLKNNLDCQNFVGGHSRIAILPPMITGNSILLPKRMHKCNLLEWILQKGYTQTLHKLISNMYLQVTFLVKYVTFGYILGINLWEV
jgi:hypothetical protein